MYFILLSLISTRFWDVVAILFSTLFHLIVWETRAFYSENIVTKTQYELLLQRISSSYWLCSGGRVYDNDLLIPTGYIVGEGGYCVYIDRAVQDTRFNNGKNSRCHIYVIGWWSIDLLLNKKVITERRTYVRGEGKFMQRGEYTILIPDKFYDGYMKSTDDYDENNFHLNCDIGADILSKVLQKTPRFSGVFFLYGKPGLGKTTTVRKLMKKYGGIICLDFEELMMSKNNPLTELQMIVKYVQPTRHYPLWVVMDDVDDFLFFSKNVSVDEEDSNYAVVEKSEMNYTEQQKQQQPSQYKWYYKNKTIKKNWCRMLDTVHQMHNVVLLLISNRHKDWFDNIDDALLRDYRITASLEYYESGIVSSSYYDERV